MLVSGWTLRDGGGGGHHVPLTAQLGTYVLHVWAYFQQFCS